MSGFSLTTSDRLAPPDPLGRQSGGIPRSPAGQQFADPVPDSCSRRNGGVNW